MEKVGIEPPYYDQLAGSHTPDLSNPFGLSSILLLVISTPGHFLLPNLRLSLALPLVLVFSLLILFTLWLLDLVFGFFVVVLAACALVSVVVRANASILSNDSLDGSTVGTLGIKLLGVCFGLNKASGFVLFVLLFVEVVLKSFLRDDSLRLCRSHLHHNF